MRNHEISTFIINTMVCNMSQMCAYQYMQESFSDIFNLDVDEIVSVFSCTSPLQTIKGMLTGIIDIYFGSDTNKKLPDGFQEGLYCMIEHTIKECMECEEEATVEHTKTLIRSAIANAADELYPEERSEEFIEYLTEVLTLYT